MEIDGECFDHTCWTKGAGYEHSRTPYLVEVGVVEEFVTGNKISDWLDRLVGQSFCGKMACAVKEVQCFGISEFACSEEIE